MHRRSFVSALVALGAGARAARPVRAAELESEDLVSYDLRLDGDPAIARRAVLLVPKRRSRRLLVLLHGLAETRNETLGIQAWPKLYGLVRSYTRLLHPPLTRSAELGYLTAARLDQLNRELEAAPFAGMNLLCPVTPNPRGQSSIVARYAQWLEETLFPAAREKLSAGEAKLVLGLDGCSMGGPVAFEVFLRKPELFGTLGGVQSAFSEPSAPRYADRLVEALQRVGPRPLHLETSTQDPFRKANERLSRELDKRKVPHELRVIPGPHDQPWLREVGTLEMLRFHDRNLGVTQ